MSSVSWFRGIKGRLLGIAVLPILGFAISSFVAFDGIDKVDKFVESAHKEIIPITKSLNDLVVARNKYGYHAWAAVAMHSNDSVREQRLAFASEAIADWRKAFATYESYPANPAVAENYSFIKDNKDRYLGMLEQVLALTKQATPESIQAAQDLLLGDVWKLGAEIAKNNGAIAKAAEARANLEGVASEKAQSDVHLWTMIINISVSAVILVIILMISSRIATVISSIAAKLLQASESVTTAVAQMNEAGTSLSQTSTEAAASLEETVASLEELSSMVQMNSDNSRQAAVLSNSSKEAAENGESEIKGLIISMGEISKSSKKIEEIISVVDDIAFQTNLLALNAAVEAARAGEQGKGFAVVAEAVRTLAQRSAVAAKDISDLIQVSVEQVEQGSRVADQCGLVLGNIVASVKKVADLNSEIAAASQEQTAGIQQISKAMNQLDQVSQSNAASAEEIAATSGEIGNLSESTRLLTVDLNVAVLGAQKQSETLPAFAEAV
ncbi:MAG: methyl-accepting chemotaxis protein [Bdellovibrio sp.]